MRTTYQTAAGLSLALLWSVAAVADAKPQEMTVKGATFAASGPFVETPVAVRYAWGVHPVADFGNRAGPAPSFRTNDWPWWVDGRYQLTEIPDDPYADQVPTRDEAQRQAWKRRVAEARTVVEE